MLTQVGIWSVLLACATCIDDTCNAFLEPWGSTTHMCKKARKKKQGKTKKNRKFSKKKQGKIPPKKKQGKKKNKEWKDREQDPGLKFSSENEQFFVDVSDIFNFFLLGGGEGGRVQGARRGGGGFYGKSQEGGGFSRVGGGGGARGREAVAGNLGGRGEG